jgi:hypothetical protein
MKHLRQLCAIAVLTFALASSTFAGDIQCGVVEPLPNSQASMTGEMDTGITASDGTLSAEVASVDPVMDFTLIILQRMLSVF